MVRPGLHAYPLHTGQPPLCTDGLPEDSARPVRANHSAGRELPFYSDRWFTVHIRLSEAYELG